MDTDLEGFSFSFALGGGESVVLESESLSNS
jgi:hypothetical protein